MMIITRLISLSSLIVTLLGTTAQVGNTQQLALKLAASDEPTLDNTESLPNTPQLLRQGNQLSINGQIKQVAWSQWQRGNSVRTGISDTAAMQRMGVELLNTDNYTQQPVQWFSQSQSLEAQLKGGYRYLDITDFALSTGWQVQVDGNTLLISSAPARVQNIRQGQQSWGSRLVVELDRPSFWQISQDRTQVEITIEASSDSALAARFQHSGTFSPVVASSSSQTTIRVKVPIGWRPKTTTINNPNRLVVDMAPDAVVERNILWAPGVRWQHQFISIGSARFPVVWLEVNLRQSGISLKPILSDRTTLVGITTLAKTAQMWQASGAVNAGFFNRKEQLPLGAIRRDGRWLSSPILNRGAIAWNDSGDVKMGHLSFQETLTTSREEHLPIVGLNSGYVQAGISRYTPDWGATYTPLTDNETIIVVQNNQVTSQKPGGAFGKTAFPMPSDGYLLIIRDNSEAIGLLAAGTTLNIESNLTPVDFSQYPNILGAGPLLLQNRQIVLDAKAEKFSDDFIREKAIRSCIGTTASGTLIIAAVDNRAGGGGPTLSELAQIIQKMGAVDAVNLDGGSSTSLYLGGQLINRSPVTAARVHNGIGIFLPSHF